MMAIPAITMRRSWRSRWPDLSDHDPPKPARSQTPATANVAVAVLALAAAHPELHDVGVDDANSLELHAAIAILDAARTLAEAINRYRSALVHAEQRDDLLPF